MRSKKSLLYILIFTLFLTFNLISCGGGGGGGGGATNDPLIVFVTSASGNGNLGSWADANGNTGLAAGDAICQAAADDAGLPGTYRAWLSTSTTDAYCHILGYDGETVGNDCGQTTLPTNAGPWVRTDGNPFAPRIDDLINNNKVFTPIRYDENGNPVSDFYFTGTYIDGTAGSSNCLDWTDGTDSESAQFGTTSSTSSAWTAYGSLTCNADVPIICFQTGTGGPLPEITVPDGAKRVFVTSVTGTGDLTSWADYSGSDTGAAAGDAICRNRAAALSLDNAATYKAWLSDSSNDAIDRFTSDGPWYRLDGVKVADNKAALIATASTPLFTAISQTEIGDYIDVQYYNVWTGTGDDGSLYGSNCQDWTDGTTNYGGYFGFATTANRDWTRFNSSLCNSNLALYCFEDE